MKALRRIPLPMACIIVSAIALAGAGAITPAAAAGSPIPVPANSGTPEGTAALIKAPPKLGAGPYTIGMPKDEAIAKMKADGMFKPGVGIRPSIGFTFKSLPDHPFIGGSLGGKNGQSGSEHVSLMFTMYPNEPVVSGITRSLRFTPATAPSVGNTLAELRKKYGPESGSNPNAPYWVFDYQGHPLSKEQMAELKKRGCLSGGALAVADTNWMAGKISKGYAGYLGPGSSATHASPACLSTVRIDVYITMKKPSGNSQSWGNQVSVMKAADWAGVASDLVADLVVTIRDTPLDYSAATVSRNAVLSSGAAAQQKERDAAKKRKPNL